MDGQRIPWDADPAAGRIIRDSALDLVPERQRAALAAALEGELAAAALATEAAAMHALLTNTEPQRTFALAEELPPDVRARLEAFSPAAVAEHLPVSVSLLHSTDDPAVPYGEALRLEQDLPDADLWTVTLFRHVDFRRAGQGEVRTVLVDLWRTWRFAHRVLGEQERAFSFVAREPTPRARDRGSRAG